jgi:uncharacterized zinc-type alcohol dehydrogenase-like protein
VGVIGLGGLGHMAVKLAVGLGADVTVMSRSIDKAADALALGADRLLVSTDEAAMAASASTFDLIIDTVPVSHALDPYLPLLVVDGTPIGGIAETQEMLDFCAKKGILPDCEMIRMDQINDAFERMARADVRYRFVIDMASLTL